MKKGYVDILRVSKLLRAAGSQQNRLARGSIRAAQRGEEAANAPRAARRQQIGSQRAQSGARQAVNAPIKQRGSPVASRAAEES